MNTRETSTAKLTLFLNSDSFGLDPIIEEARKLTSVHEGSWAGSGEPVSCGSESQFSVHFTQYAGPGSGAVNGEWAR